jgi:hypothetical protein
VDGEVTFIKGGKVVILPLDRLCEADQNTIRGLQAGIAPSADEPPADRPPVPAPAESIKPASDPAADSQPPPLARRRLPTIANRVWTFADGQQTTAKFVRVFRDSVVLLRGSRTAMYSYYALSPADQDYVKEILTARGEETLIPPPVTVVMDDPSQMPEAVAPPTAAAGNNENGEPGAAAAPSAAFDELRRREEEQRAQLAAELEAETAASKEAPAEVAAANETAPEESSGNRGSAPSAIGSEKLADWRPALIIGGVAIGVFGLVAVIIAVASASGRSQVRRYS